MTGNSIALRTGGRWLTAGAVLLVLVLALHGPLHPNLRVQMTRIADSAARWAIVHWMAAFSLSCLAGAALLILLARSRLTEAVSTTSAWMVVLMGAVWTLTTAVTEVTVIADLATRGDASQFEAWWSFAEGNGNGFAALAVGVAVIAWYESRQLQPLVPGWSCMVGAVTAIASCLGWVLGVWFNVGPANLVWVFASGLMCVWLAWLGIGMASNTGAPQVADSTPRAP